MGDLATPSDLMMHERVQATCDYYAVVKWDKLQREHNDFPPVATMAREDKM